MTIVSHVPQNLFLLGAFLPGALFHVTISQIFPGASRRFLRGRKMSAALGVGAGLSAVGSTVGGIMGALNSGRAAKEEENALQNYFNLAQGQSQTNTQNFAPYLATGAQGAQEFNQLMPSLTQGFNPTVAQLQATPGYQFEQQQGQMGTNNAMAAQGLSGSGAELGALNQFNTGLANNTYSSLANIYNQNRATTLGVLQGATGLGEQAAGDLGGINANVLGQQGTALTGIGQAGAGGIMGMSAAISGIGSGIGSTAADYAALGGKY